MGDTYHVVEEVPRGKGELAFLTMYSHIIARRDLEGRGGERFAREAVPEILARGKLDRICGPPTGRRADIVFRGNRAVLSLYRFEERETWVLSGFEDWSGPDGTGG